MVQTRWGHLNAMQSLLTMAQATGLNNHFIIDQEGRNKGGYFINFNGTAGIWKKECITDAGGWKSDTLTEDLDLSYRAQIRGLEIQLLFKHNPYLQNYQTG
jgi:cellulose synthase/poly-beta-1,6-N-acetylglucosamine synthase-like glycosyltransferase